MMTLLVLYDVLIVILKTKRYETNFDLYHNFILKFF